MNKTTMILLVILGFGVIGLVYSAIPTQEPELEFTWSNETPETIFSYSPFTPTENMTMEINGKFCEEVPYPCHKNNPMCLSICYSCKRSVDSGGNK